MNTKDDLTGLPNRQQFSIAFLNSVKNNQRQCREFSLLVLNLNSLKTINNTFGKDSGDLVLTVFAKILSDCIRYRDQVFRYGGDEFVILLSDAEKTSVPYIVDRINKAVTENELLSEFLLTCHIGCAHYQEEDDLESLFTRAEQSLTIAKKPKRQVQQLSAFAV